MSFRLFIADVDPSLPALLHLESCEFLDPWEKSLHERNTTMRSPTVGANCRGIVTTDVLEQGLSCRAITLGGFKGLMRTKDTSEFIY